MELVELLDSVEIFQGLSSKMHQTVAAIFEERRLMKGEVLFSQGDKADQLFLVMDGFLQVSTTMGHDAREHAIVDLGFGQSIGEMSWIDRGNRSGTVSVASESASVAVTSFASLDALCRKNPDIGYRVMSNIAADLSFRLRLSNPSTENTSFPRAADEGSGG